MASDIPPEMHYEQGNNFSISVQCQSAEEIEQLYAALGEGGKATMPSQDVPWGARFGILTDKFGLRWIFNFTRSPDV